MRYTYYLPTIQLAVALVAEASTDPLAQWASYGALGMVVLGAITGQVRFKPEVTALRDAMTEQAREHADERRRMQTQIDTLLDVHQSQVLPALLSSAEALRTSAQQTQAMVTALARVEAAVSTVADAVRRARS